MKRFHLIEGLPNELAPDDSISRRYLGQRLKALPRDAAGQEVPMPPNTSLVERYEPEEQWMEGAHVERAIAKGSVRLIATVKAETLEDAKAVFAQSGLDAKRQRTARAKQADA